MHYSTGVSTRQNKKIGCFLLWAYSFKKNHNYQWIIATSIEVLRKVINIVNNRNNGNSNMKTLNKWCVLWYWKISFFGFDLWFHALKTYSGSQYYLIWVIFHYCFKNVIIVQTKFFKNYLWKCKTCVSIFKGMGKI